MSKENQSTTAPAPAPKADLTAAAEALAANAAEQSQARATAAADEADTAARAYKLLQADCKAGGQPKGWSHYIEQAAKNQ